MLMLSPTQRRQIATDALRANPDWSDRRIARETGVCRDTVRRLRAGLIRDGVVAGRDAITGADGKTYPLKPDQQRAAPSELARRTMRVLDLIRSIDPAVHRQADDLTRRSFRIAVERLALVARRLDQGRPERNTG